MKEGEAILSRIDEERVSPIEGDRAPAPAQRLRS
jgi:hypothetical protein